MNTTNNVNVKTNGLTKINMRNEILKTIQIETVGPGSDIFAGAPENEIISENPTRRYMTGMLYPRSFDKEDDQKENSSTEEETIIENAGYQQNAEENASNDFVIESHNKESEDESNDDLYSITDSFHPHRLGLTICLPKGQKKIEFSLHYGKYEKCKLAECCLTYTDEDKEHFVTDMAIIKDNFADLLNYYSFDEKSCSVRFKEDIDAEQRTKLKGILSTLKTTEKIENFQFSKYAWKLYCLIDNRYKRKQVSQEGILTIQDGKINLKEHYISLEDELILLTQVKEKGDFIFFKIILSNENNNKKRGIYGNTLFQLEFRLISDCFESISQSQISSEFSDEDKNLNYLYSTIKNYGVGHGVSVSWDNENEKPQWVGIDFLPKHKLKGVSTKFDISSLADNEADLQDFNNIFDIWTLSLFNKVNELDNPNPELIQRLKKLPDFYGQWIENKLTEVAGNEIGKRNAEKCKEIKKRIDEGIEILLNDKNAWNAFLFANAAFYVQFYHHQKFFKTNKIFKKHEDWKTEFGENAFPGFEDYYERTNYPDQNEFPAWRPFQLAFLLLSVKSFVEPESADRTIVDLIWFPTGGGKTEAYLAVAAFYIFYNRLVNGTKSSGINVITRYTLRLLTAQQFERTAKIILSCELIRRQMPDKLGEMMFSIGFWAGSGVTPNKVEDFKPGKPPIIQQCLCCNSRIDYIKKFPKITTQKDKKKQVVVSFEFKSNRLISICSNPDCTFGYDDEKLRLSIANFVNKITGPTRIQNDAQYDKVLPVVSPNSKGYFTAKFKHYGVEQFPTEFTLSANDDSRIETLTAIKASLNKILPIYIIDEQLYQTPPTFLFGTVDKFARLAWIKEDENKFIRKNNNRIPPGLIIQDELHLLNGSLGSITGLYENVIQELCTSEKGGKKIKPKIIASSATVKNVDSQIQELYGRDSIAIFPEYINNTVETFFSNTDKSKRLYMGICPIGRTLSEAQLRLNAILLYARMKACLKDNSENAHKYWTIINFFHSLREVGQFKTKAFFDIQGDILPKIHFRHLENVGNRQYLNRVTKCLKELTGRIPNSEIKQNLNDLSIGFKNFEEINEKNVIDLVAATNMIATGLDVTRLNLMIVNRMPSHIAEYIQATSRIGREDEALVLTLLDAANSRDISYFEHFSNFHQAYYRYIEPLSITPYTDSVFDKALFTLMIAYYRVVKEQTNVSLSPENKKEDLSKIRKEFTDLIASLNTKRAEKDVDTFVEKYLTAWTNKTWEADNEKKEDVSFYIHNDEDKSLLKTNSANKKDILVTLNSLRDIGEECELYINDGLQNNNNQEENENED